MNCRINKQLSIRKIDDEVFIYNRDKSLVHAFNKTGVKFWEALSQNIPFEELRDEVLNEYEVEPEQLKKDFQDFKNQLVNLGIIEYHD
ncbi:hypothetical protein CHISP_2755 [Chitinispirillum alkaliphilum]|nr:hypothetical protein CHISP_2755 [Chitinispirillum alkaliphilum]